MLGKKTKTDYAKGMQRYIDAHCHLQKFSNLTDVIQRAKGLGICGFVCNSTSSADWNKVIELGKSYSNIYPCIGIHPWCVDKTSYGDILRMHELLKSDSRIMVGEIGLDKLHPDMKTQEDIFIKQLILAAEFNRSVHIHCVGAWDRLLHILKGLREKVPHLMVLHGFAGSVEISRSLLREYNVFFSFSPVINNWKSRLNVIKEMPLDRVLVESDDANPDVILEVVKKISEVLGLSVAQVADAIYDNSQRFLKDGQAA